MGGDGDSTSTRTGGWDDIQQTGAEPAPFKPSSSWNYGVGGFLLAGSEIRRMDGAKAEVEGVGAPFGA